MNTNNRIMEKKELNLVEILKDCPKGTKLYSPVCGECILDEVRGRDSVYPISVSFHTDDGVTGECNLTSDGRYYFDVNAGECILFPNKDNRDWSTFKVEKPKWNPDTLQPFDKVLARDEETAFWGGDFYLYTDKETGSDFPYCCVGTNNRFCIPYNEETKHLLGTNKEAPEYYRV